MRGSLDSDADVVNEQELVTALKEKGMSDPETVDMLQRWCSAQEAEVEKAGTVDARIDFELRRADVYFEAGYEDDSYNTFCDAMTLAEQLGRLDLCERVSAEMKKFSS